MRPRELLTQLAGTGEGETGRCRRRGGGHAHDALDGERRQREQLVCGGARLVGAKPPLDSSPETLHSSRTGTVRPARSARLETAWASERLEIDCTSEARPSTALILFFCRLPIMSKHGASIPAAAKASSLRTSSCGRFRQSSYSRRAWRRAPRRVPPSWRRHPASPLTRCGRCARRRPRGAREWRRVARAGRRGRPRRPRWSRAQVRRYRARYCSSASSPADLPRHRHGADAPEVDLGDLLGELFVEVARLGKAGTAGGIHVL